MQSGWLLEKGKQGALERIYFGVEKGEFNWTADHMKALRFARKEDAELFSETGIKAGYGLIDLREPHLAVEHGWGDD